LADPTLISDFTGADDTPLSEGGNWAAVDTAVTSYLQRVSNAASGAASGFGKVSYWTPANFGPNLEAYLTITNTASSAGIVFRIQGEGGTNTWDGYYAYSSANAFDVVRVDNNVATSLLGVPGITPNWAAGDKIGVSVTGSSITVWRLRAADPSAWKLLGRVVDATYASAGKIGVLASGTAVRVDDFFAGTDTTFFQGAVSAPAEFPPRHFGPF